MEKVGGDRKSEKSFGKSSQMITDPRRRFSEIYDANEKYAQQAYALVRDQAAADAVASGGHVKDAYEALTAREAESNSDNAKRARLEASAPESNQGPARNHRREDVAEGGARRRSSKREGKSSFRN